MKKKIAVLSCGWSSYYLNNFINGMMKAVKDKETDIYFFTAYNYTEFSGYQNFAGFSIFNLINYDEYDGVIILSDLIGNIRILEKERLKIIKSGKPAVTINHKLEGITNLHVDNYTAFYDLINHLIKDHGITNIGYVGGEEKSLDFAERYKAYRTAFNDNQIKINMENVMTIEKSDYHFAYNFFVDYLRQGKSLPEAMVCANDLIAYGLIKALDENNIKIPDQIKIIGFDDLSYSKSLTPGLTTVKSNAEEIGFEAVNRVLSGNMEVQQLKLKAMPVYRESCGCLSEDRKQGSLSLDILNELNKNAEFSTQMERMEEIFTEAVDVFTLLTNLEIFFTNSHHFEGTDFCIFLKSDWSSVLINSAENLPQNLSYGPQVQSIVSIQNNKKYMRELISTSDLLPAKIKAGESNLYVFLPIFNHSYVHGYFVTKNNLSLVDNHYGYIWSRTFGTCIERFRKKNMYKQMSQQFFKLSTRDSLSGMLNRIGLEKLAKPFYAQNKKNGLTSVLFFVDINSMKTINDKFGHLHGDLAVKTISAAVMEVVPRNWLCIRYGGDEFLVVGNSKNYNGEDYCAKITERIKSKTAVMRLPYVLSASVGTYNVPPNSELTLEQAVEKVDEIMYKKKQQYHQTH